MAIRALVTGATGHIGNHVLRDLLATGGWQPIAFARPGADRRALAGLDVEVREGDLVDADSVKRAVTGCEVVFHVGAVHRNWSVDPQDILRPAVEGTRNVWEAARDAGVRRIVYTSTGATIGFAKAEPLDETHFLTEPKAAYIRGKVLAERWLREQVGGPEVVTLNPSGVFGPRDWRLTPASRAIVGMLQGDPAWLKVCVTDVRDVAHAHVLAVDRGRAGERYAISGENLTPAQVADAYQRLAGVRPPVMTPPGFLLRLLGWWETRKAARSGSDAAFDPDALKDVDGGALWYDNRKSRGELGMVYRPPDDVLRDTFRWLLFVDALKPKVAEKVRAALGPAAAPDPDWTR